MAKRSADVQEPPKRPQSGCGQFLGVKRAEISASIFRHPISCRSWTTYNLSRGKVAPHLSGPRLINLEGGAHSIVLTCDHPIETSTIGFVVIL